MVIVVKCQMHTPLFPSLCSWRASLAQLMALSSGVCLVTVLWNTGLLEVVREEVKLEMFGWPLRGVWLVTQGLVAELDFSSRSSPSRCGRVF